MVTRAWFAALAARYEASEKITLLAQRQCRHRVVMATGHGNIYHIHYYCLLRLR